jgi:hypothetical protein
MKAVIIGGGESLKGFDFSLIPPDCARIGVNGSAEYTHLDVWFTLDPGPRNMGQLNKLPPDVRKVMAVPHSFPRLDYPDVTFLERIEGTKGRLKARLGLYPYPGGVSTGNSLYGALNLAVHLGVKRIALLGLDAYGDGHWYDPEEFTGPMDHLPQLFDSSIPELVRRGIEVVNGSPESLVKSFTRMTPEEACEWL